MARHECPSQTCHDGTHAITYRWRLLGMETPRWLDLHPVVNEWRGPRWLVVGAYHFWRIAVRSHVEFGD